LHTPSAHYVLQQCPTPRSFSPNACTHPARISFSSSVLLHQGSSAPSPARAQCALHSAVVSHTKVLQPPRLHARSAHYILQQVSYTKVLQPPRLHAPRAPRPLAFTCLSPGPTLTASSSSSAASKWSLKVSSSSRKAGLRSTSVSKSKPPTWPSWVGSDCGSVRFKGRQQGIRLWQCQV